MAHCALKPLYLDIETTYSCDPDVRSRIAAGIKPPGNIKKAETLAKWEQESKPLVVQEALDKTALNGGYGHITAIGFAVGDEDVQVLVGDEDELLSALFGLEFEEGARPVIVGHNIIKFDLRFILHRAVVLGIRIPHWFPRRSLKPWSEEAFDTMVRWAGDRDLISQDELAAILGIEVANALPGKDCPKAFYDGQLKKILEHCKEDLRVVREIHRRMVAVGL